MASINFNNLRNTSKNVDKYTYTDIYLDLMESIVGGSTNFSRTDGAGRDLKVSYDLNAIRNSLINLFNTVPGERYLLPEYGSDLRRYIFEPITDIRGRQIGREIQRAIVNWEPRVRLVDLNIVGYADRNEYNISIKLNIPFLNTALNLNSMLTREGYTLV